MTRGTDDDEDWVGHATVASPGVSTPQADLDSRDRRRAIMKVAREIAERSADLNERLR